MKTRTELEWAHVLVACEVKPITAARWAQPFAEQMVEGALSAGERELDDFLGQILHESKRLEKMEEDLYYTSPGRLMAVWPSRFPTRESELPYLRNPEALANKVYGGRMGNVNPGDGWRFRARTPIGLTGRDNYKATGDALGLELVGFPEQLMVPAVALRVAIRWWERTLPDSVMDNVVAVTKRVNGGDTGLADRIHLTALAKSALGLA